MISSIFICADQIQDHSCKILRAGRRTELVRCNGKRSSGLCCLQNTVYKVASTLSVYPVTADDKVLVSKFFDVILAGSLRSAVNSQRIGVIKFCVRFLALSVKYIICGKLNDLGTTFAGNNA